VPRPKPRHFVCIGTIEARKPLEMATQISQGVQAGLRQINSAALARQKLNNCVIYKQIASLGLARLSRLIRHLGRGFLTTLTSACQLPSKTRIRRAAGTNSAVGARSQAKYFRTNGMRYLPRILASSFAPTSPARWVT
jgi:hypothetical protein